MSEQKVYSDLYKPYSLVLHREKDADLIAYLDRCRNKTETIRQALTQYIRKEQKDELSNISE